MKIGKSRPPALKTLSKNGDSPSESTKGTALFTDQKSTSTSAMRLDRSWQCGTVQLDMALPEKFELEYMDSGWSAKNDL